jgi:hypothetical protein
MQQYLRIKAQRPDVLLFVSTSASPLDEMSAGTTGIARV